MSERLKFFRKLISAFEGTSNPQRAVERGFYVNLPNNPVGELARRIEVSPWSTRMLLGGIGSGKTTQLLLIQNALNELEDIKAIYVDVSLVTDISDLKPGALIAIIGLELIKILDEINEPELEECKKKIENFAHGYSKTLTLSKETIEPREKESSIDYQGLLSNEKHKVRKSLIQALSVVNKAVKEKIRKEIVFLLDGLDRLSDLQVFINSALSDISEIENGEIGSVTVASITLTEIVRESILGFLYHVPYLDVFDSIEARQFFIDVLTVRDPENIITPDARLSLISNSGGVLRDLISISQSSIEEAYLDGSEKITLQHVSQAILPFYRAKLMGLGDSEIKTLRLLVSQKSFFPSSPEQWKLLHSGHILEYRYPEHRFVVHPAIASVIQNKVTSGSDG